MKRGLSLTLLFTMAMVPYVANGLTREQLRKKYGKKKVAPQQIVEKSKKQKNIPKKKIVKKSNVPLKKKQPTNNKQQRVNWGKWFLNKLKFQ